MARIIVVDDDTGTRAILTALIASGGHTVDAAADGLAAAQMLERERYDAAVIDVFMPVIDGLELVRGWRREHPHLKIVVISGGALGPDVFENAMQLGAAATLRKPVTLDHLLGTLKTVLA